MLDVIRSNCRTLPALSVLRASSSGFVIAGIALCDLKHNLLIARVASF